MHVYPRKGNYDRDPRVLVRGHAGRVRVGIRELAERLKSAVQAGKRRFSFVLYPGADAADACAVAEAAGVRVIDADCARRPEQTIDDMFREELTDDRVFGVLTHRQWADVCDGRRLKALRAAAADGDFPVAVIGVGAALVLENADEIWYWDMPRWEIQLRFRRGAGTWLFRRAADAQLTKYKQGYFIEWRMADRHKTELFPRVDVWVDASVQGMPRAIPADAFLAAMETASHQPIHMQAYFDPSVWGGKWMQHVFDLPDNAQNWGWAFDGVPEENALKFDFEGETAVFPAMDLVLSRPEALLGSRVFARFGAEFPIRFDFLDTFEGGNLSLQVHPLTGYIQNAFGMHYTQDESYYIMDAGEDGCVYLGLREGVTPDALRAALARAQAGEGFDAERYVNRFPVKAHDHVLIPAGTIHGAGKNTCVLEISATPYIFTFKLWDWGRLGLDGLPRPVHIEHGMKNIRFERDTKWVCRELLHRTTVLRQEAGCVEERTGLHETEFIETHRYDITRTITLSRNDTVAVINLVAGETGTISSPDGSFPACRIHYAETFILPAGAGEFSLTPDAGARTVFIVATVR